MMSANLLQVFRLNDLPRKEAKEKVTLCFVRSVQIKDAPRFLWMDVQGRSLRTPTKFRRIFDWYERVR